MIGAIFIVRPLHHRVNVMIAERMSDRAYQSGNAYVFDVVIRYEVDGQS